MIKKKQKNKDARYFFLVSLAIHAVLLFFLGRSIINKRYERRIEVDLRHLAPARPIRNIPLPYRKANPETKDSRTPMKVLSKIRPIPPMKVPASSPVMQQTQKRRFPQDVAEPILIPVHDGKTTKIGGIAAGEIKGFEIPQYPAKIAPDSDSFDQVLAYQGLIRRHIERHKSFPPLAVKRGMEGRVGIRFLIRRNGQVENIEVTKSSRFPILDDAAVSAVNKGVPFPPFPDGISYDHMIIEITLIFELMKGIH